MTLWQRLIQRYWWLAPLLLLTVVLLDQNDNPAPVANETVTDMRTGEADYYLESFTTRHFDATGKLVYLAHGDSLGHFPDDDHSEIERPVIELTRRDSKWLIDAPRGRFDPDPDTFRLEGGVTIRRLPFAAVNDADDNHRKTHEAEAREAIASEPVTIRTETVAVATEANEVHTDAPVSVAGAGFELNALGMSSAIDSGNLALHGDVRATYQPPTREP
ncbi:MAG: LPS export ABC transporter periplasmic protein LptC [Gammaproteobacteria bacterium]|nr:MAG: LPS export ABC transporter periplasmic protein LptC [Gammaproteobacteria bacterium]PIE37604.1 MAG: LPS export ABC transporter periplasmic protein LptC [Gammaproteobacteria bacterium]